MFLKKKKAYAKAKHELEVFTKPLPLKANQTVTK